MSSIGLRPTPTLWYAVPVLTALIGTMGLGGGIMNFTKPHDAAKLFGIAIPSSAQQLDNADTEPEARQRAYCEIHGIRNIASGLSALGLTGFWFISSQAGESPVVLQAIRRCIGISFLAGSSVALVDGVILSRFTKARGLEKDAVELAKSKGMGHAITALPLAALGVFWMI